MLFAHARAVPKFRYSLNREAPLENCKFPFIPGEKLPSAGFHPHSVPCTFALRDLGYYIGKVNCPVEDPWKVQHDKEFAVHGPSFSYTGKVPFSPGYAKETGRPTDKDWDIGVFMALPLTHVEFREREDLGIANNARSAGYEVLTLDW
jgi:hypothetical protein